MNSLTSLFVLSVAALTSTATVDRRVSVAYGEWTDASRDRTIPYKLYVPDGDGPFPVVVHSHGLGGSREGSTYILEKVAAAGFVVVALQHPGSDTAILERSDVRQARGGLGLATTLGEAARQRYGDVPFAVRQIDAMQTTAGPARGKLDLTRIGMSGHSFGALSTLVAAGQTVPRAAAGGWREPRLRAAIVYSPNKPMAGDARTALAGVAIPMLHFTGTEDRTRFDLEQTPWERTAAFQAIDRADQFLIVLAGGDHMIFNGQRPTESPAPEAQRRLIVDETVRFWRAYLADDREALEALCGLPARVKPQAEGYTKATRCGSPTPIRPVDR
jgi:predicted dienelactone hydrolase